MSRIRNVACLAALTIAPLTVLVAPTMAKAADPSVVVIDGDTLIINGETVRIQGIDTPEAGEACHDRATAVLQRLVATGDVRVTSRDGKDRYGRTVASVSAGGRDVGLALLKAGVARAAYDSRDGYGRHANEASYHRAERNTSCTDLPAPVEPEQGQTDPPFWTWATLGATAGASGYTLDQGTFITAHGNNNAARAAAAEAIWYAVAERNALPEPAPLPAPAPAPSRNNNSNNGGSSNGGGRLNNDNPYDDGGPRRADGSCPPGGCT